MEIPTEFTEQFLNWFRERTEAAWAEYQPQTFEDYVAAGVGGRDWQRGTRWLGGLSEAQIEEIERRWSLHFPPDYRLFLRVLHAVDRPKRGAKYTEYVEGGEPSHLVPNEKPSFYNWLTDAEALQQAFDWLVEGLQFDVEYNGLWLPSWGAMPSRLATQRARVRKLVAAAPRLIPIIGHRYLLAEPCQAGNPVFSIYQSDIIVYGPDLRSYFLFEFADLLGIDWQETERIAREQRASEETYAAIPFWGELYRYNNAPPSER